jgi:hypothetical protein
MGQPRTFGYEYTFSDGRFCGPVSGIVAMVTPR